MGYRIGSFNIRKLSFATTDDDPEDKIHTKRDYSTIGSIIRENFDIVGLQEIMNENVLPLLFPKYCGWNYSWKQSRSKVDDSSEGYAFAWNERILRPVTEPEIWTQYRQDPFLGEHGLVRHPYYGRFTPSGTPSAGPFVEFRLINTHIRFNPSINQFLPGGDTELRKREFDVLTKQILNRLTDRRYGNNMPGYTILLGDFNMNLRNSGAKSPYVESITAICDDAGYEKRFITVQDELSTLSRRKELNSNTGDTVWVFDGLSNNYDHFTYSETSFSERGVLPSAGTLDAVSLYMNRDFEQYWRKVSDHLPIILEINLR